MNVFVFPACNEPGLEIIRSLTKSNKITLFGGSSSQVQYDPARHLLKNYVVCPQFGTHSFAGSFKEILRQHEIDVVFPAWDPLVAEFSGWRMDTTVFVTPRSEIAELCLSKGATYRRLHDVVPTPRVFTPDKAPLPLFAKPDRDSGSRNTMEVRTEHQLRVAIEHGLMLCEYLPGEEFTVDCVSDLSGKLLFANPRLRAKIGRGIALGTTGVDDARLLEYVERIAQALKIEGPWFAQFRQNANGDPVLMEINARVAGSMTHTRLSGINIPLIAFFLYTGDDVRIPQMRRGTLMNRSLSNFVHVEADFEWVIWDWDDTLVRKDGKPDPEAVACLYDLHNRGIRQLLLSRNPQLAQMMKIHHIPPFFVDVRQADDKVAELQRMISDHHIEPSRCIMVNDSYAERFEVEERYPDLRVVSPDGLEALGRERA